MLSFSLLNKRLISSNKNMNINNSFTNFTKFIKLSKFNFARKKTTNLATSNNNNKNEIELDNENVKIINVVREEVPIKISPYFNDAVSEREKSATNISISQLIDSGSKNKKNESEILKKQKAEVVKTKQKLVSAKKQSKTIGVIMENIKRELPKEL
jgi:hypothetical protein